MDKFSINKSWDNALGAQSLELCEKIYNIKLKDIVKVGKIDDIAESLLLAFYGLLKHDNNESSK